MRSLPLIIVVGANDLAVRVCEELCSTQGHDVVAVWENAHSAPLIERAGATFAQLSPNEYEALESVGVREAACIIPVCEDDRLNLQVALKARDLNPQIRIVLRQFNRALGRKIEQNLPNCTAISPATHAAATYAGAAVDPSCLYAVQFPGSGGTLLGFSERKAAGFGLQETTVGEAEGRLGIRIVGVNGKTAISRSEPIGREDTIVACAPVRALQPSHAHRGSKTGRRARTHTSLRGVVRRAARFEPLVLYTFGAGTVMYVAAVLYFMASMHISAIESLYFVAATMFTVGYGDITPYTHHAPWPTYAVSIVVMAAGVTVGGVFIATIASALNRAQETALRGLRRIQAEDHVVVCGAGNVGTRVIEFLLEMEQRVVVIEPRPSALIVEHARTRRIELLASDATDDETLGFCDLRRAYSLVAVTDSDTANLEAALGALVDNPDLPVVMRITDPQFSRSVERNLKIAKSFSASELTAPAIAGLARFPSSRGRVTFAHETFNINERTGDMTMPREEDGIPLYVWRAGALRPIRDFGEVRDGDRVLDMVPLSQFKAG